jgi:hypothetical protein
MDKLEKFAFVKESCVGKRKVRMPEVLECRKNHSVDSSWIFHAYGKKELSVQIISCVESHAIILGYESVDISMEFCQQEIITNGP